MSVSKTEIVLSQTGLSVISPGFIRLQASETVVVISTEENPHRKRLQTPLAMYSLVRSYCKKDYSKGHQREKEICISPGPFLPLHFRPSDNIRRYR